MLSGWRGLDAGAQDAPIGMDLRLSASTDIDARAADLAWFIGVGGFCVRFFDIVDGRKRDAGGVALRFGWFCAWGFVLWVWGHSDEGTLAVF